MSGDSGEASGGDEENNRESRSASHITHPQVPQPVFRIQMVFVFLPIRIRVLNFESGSKKL